MTGAQSRLSGCVDPAVFDRMAAKMRSQTDAKQIALFRPALKNDAQLPGIQRESLITLLIRPRRRKRVQTYSVH